MKRQRYYSHLEHYWEAVHKAERSGKAIAWKYDYLEVRQTESGLYWIDFPGKLPDDLKNNLYGRTWGTEGACVVRAKIVAKVSCGRGVRLHVVNCVDWKGVDLWKE